METVGGLLRGWRHTRRLSQLDLALAADVSQRYVSLVEGGRSNPSAAMVLRLADRLEVPLRDRNRLLVAAGFAPKYRERPLDGPDMAAVRDALARILHAHEPYPALIVDRRWNIVMANAPVDFFLADVDPALLRPPVNMVRLGFDPRGLAPRILNLPEVRTFFRRGCRVSLRRPVIPRSARSTTSSSRSPNPSPSPSPKLRTSCRPSTWQYR